MALMTVSFYARDLSTFHVRNLSLSRQDVGSQAHIFGRELVTINEQISVEAARAIAKRFHGHEVLGTSGKYLFRQCCCTERIAGVSEDDHVMRIQTDRAR